MVHTCDTDRGHCAALKAAHQDAAQSIAQGCGLATLEGTDKEHAGLGAIIGNLMLDAIDLVLQHVRMRGRGRLPENGAIQTRRRLGRRQPLWGRGVTSRIKVISRPAT